MIEDPEEWVRRQSRRLRLGCGFLIFAAVVFVPWLVLELRLRVSVSGSDEYLSGRTVLIFDRGLVREGRRYRCSVDRRRPHRLNIRWTHVVPRRRDD